MNMQLGNMRSPINIENITKQSEEIIGINIIDENVSDERDHIGENG